MAANCYLKMKQLRQFCLKNVDLEPIGSWQNRLQALTCLFPLLPISILIKFLVVIIVTIVTRTVTTLLKRLLAMGWEPQFCWLLVWHHLESGWLYLSAFLLPPTSPPGLPWAPWEPRPLCCYTGPPLLPPEPLVVPKALPLWRASSSSLEVVVEQLAPLLPPLLLPA